MGYNKKTPSHWQPLACRTCKTQVEPIPQESHSPMVDARRLQFLLTMTRQIQRTTVFVDSSGLSPEETLPTAADLARSLGVKDHEQIKKNLKFLREAGLIRALGLNPKRYRFDAYSFKQLRDDPPDPETDLFGALLAELVAEQTQSTSTAP